MSRNLNTYLNANRIPIWIVSAMILTGVVVLSVTNSIEKGIAFLFFGIPFILITSFIVHLLNNQIRKAYAQGIKYGTLRYYAKPEVRRISVTSDSGEVYYLYRAVFKVRPGVYRCSFISYKKNAWVFDIDGQHPIYN